MVKLYHKQEWLDAESLQRVSGCSLCHPHQKWQKGTEERDQGPLCLREEAGTRELPRGRYSLPASCAIFPVLTVPSHVALRIQRGSSLPRHSRFGTQVAADSRGHLSASSLSCLLPGQSEMVRHWTRAYQRTDSLKASTRVREGWRGLMWDVRTYTVSLRGPHRHMFASPLLLPPALMTWGSPRSWASRRGSLVPSCWLFKHVL